MLNGKLIYVGLVVYWFILVEKFVVVNLVVLKDKLEFVEDILYTFVKKGVYYDWFS